jgi:ketosteroid isomerase-like protein
MLYVSILPAMLVILAGSPASHVQHVEAEVDIRALRIQYNDTIERRDVEGFANVLSPTFVELLSSGSVTTNAVAVAESYRAIEFQDPAFIAYDRHTDTVDISSNGALAVERGRWAARYHGQNGDELRGCGRYQAGWVRADGRWLIQTESYVDLSCDAPAIEPRAHPGEL